MRIPGSSTVERSVVNYTAEHHKPLFWRRLATKPSPLVVPQLCPQLAFLNILSFDSLQDHELLFFRCASFLQKDLSERCPTGLPPNRRQSWSGSINDHKRLSVLIRPAS